MKHFPLRIQLIGALSEVFRGRSTDELLEVVPLEARAWMSENLLGSLRYWGRCQWILRQYSSSKAPSGFMRRALVPAIYSILEQDRINPVQVINETVEIIKEKEGKSPAGFANVCLRRILEQKDHWKNPPFPKDSDNKTQAEWASLPDWLWTQILSEMGFEKSLEWSKNSLRRSAQWIRWLNGVPTEEQCRELTEMGWKAYSADFPKIWGSHAEDATGVMTLLARFPTHIYVQDLSNQLIIEKVAPLLKGRELVDRCAAPGGKSLALSDLSVKVLAIDQSEKRIEWIRQNQARLGISFPVMSEAEWRNGSSGRSMSAIWIDAPCSSLGLIQRHPEIRWTRTQLELSRLVELQKTLLEESFSGLVEGGVLIYTVCSLLKAESALHAQQLFRQETVESMDSWRDTSGLGDGIAGFFLFKNIKR